MKNIEDSISTILDMGGNVSFNLPVIDDGQEIEDWVEEITIRLNIQEKYIITNKLVEIKNKGIGKIGVSGPSGTTSGPRKPKPRGFSCKEFTSKNKAIKEFTVQVGDKMASLFI